MYRVTTPTNTFKLPFNPNTASKFLITYWQEGKILFEKTIDDLEMDEESVSVTLTQEETIKFKAGSPVKVQIRAKIANKVIASNVLRISVDDVLNEEVL